MNVYKLEHQYSRSHKFYGVRTTLTFHELNVLCAYLQLLHFELPVLMAQKIPSQRIMERNYLKPSLMLSLFMKRKNIHKHWIFMITGMNTVVAVWVNICMRLFRLPDQMRTKIAAKYDS